MGVTWCQKRSHRERTKHARNYLHCKTDINASNWQSILCDTEIDLLSKKI